jgi:hypothetical protein
MILIAVYRSMLVEDDMVRLNTLKHLCQYFQNVNLCIKLESPWKD